MLINQHLSSNGGGVQTKHLNLNNLDIYLKVISIIGFTHKIKFWFDNIALASQRQFFLK